METGRQARGRSGVHVLKAALPIMWAIAVAQWWVITGCIVIAGGVWLYPSVLEVSTALAGTGADWFPLIFLVWVLATSVACLLRGLSVSSRR